MARLGQIFFVALFSIIFGQESDLVFLVLGDWGDSFYWEEGSAQYNVSVAMNEWAGIHQPSFILTTGDNFYPDGVRSADDAWFEQKWQNIYTGEYIRNLDWRISLGNHDYDPKDDRAGPNAGGNEMFQVYRSRIDLQWNLPHLWWEFTEPSPAGDVHFIVLDTEAIQNRLNNYTEEIIWIQETLAASTAAVKLVIGHRNVYTLGKYAPGYDNVQNLLIPLFDDYDVDAYICGHDHSLQWIAFANGTGPDYIVSAAGGRSLNTINKLWELIFDADGFVTEYREQFGFSGVTINATHMATGMFDQYGELLFDIVRPIGQYRQTLIWDRPWDLEHGTSETYNRFCAQHWGIVCRFIDWFIN